MARTTELISWVPAVEFEIGQFTEDITGARSVIIKMQLPVSDPPGMNIIHRLSNRVAVEEVVRMLREAGDILWPRN